MAAKLEARLIKARTLVLYNKELWDFVEHGVLREISKDEMEAWKGPMNYISHHGMEKIQSASTKL